MQLFGSWFPDRNPLLSSDVVMFINHRDFFSHISFFIMGKEYPSLAAAYFQLGKHVKVSDHEFLPNASPIQLQAQATFVMLLTLKVSTCNTMNK